MKMNEMIREKRLIKGLTQEQMASMLGVSAPAVNKWEKGVSYPDITLLPALARLLETDLNTLLSFQEDLSDGEIADFLGSIYTMAMEEGVAAAFVKLEEKIREYPSCDKLILNGALTLEGLLVVEAGLEEKENYEQKIEKMYVRAANSKNIPIRNQAKAMLASKYMNRKEYEKAEHLIDELPDETLYDKWCLKSTLYLAQDKTADAAVLLERMVVQNISGIISSLLSLMEIAMKEGRKNDMEILAEITRQTIRLYDLWEYEEYAIDFQVAMIKEDASLCFASLKKMIDSMKEKSSPVLADSPLYRHLPSKEPSQHNTNGMGEMLMGQLIDEINDPDHHEYDFLREDTAFQTFLSQWRKKMSK